MKNTMNLRELENYSYQLLKGIKEQIISGKCRPDNLKEMAVSAYDDLKHQLESSLKGKKIKPDSVQSLRNFMERKLILLATATEVVDLSRQQERITQNTKMDLQHKQQAFGVISEQLLFLSQHSPFYKEAQEINAERIRRQKKKPKKSGK